MNNKSNQLKLADYILNFTRTCIYISVMYYILHCVTAYTHAFVQFTRQKSTKVNHVYIMLYTRVHDSSYVSKWLP